MPFQKRYSYCCELEKKKRCDEHFNECADNKECACKNDENNAISKDASAECAMEIMFKCSKSDDASA